MVPLLKDIWRVNSGTITHWGEFSKLIYKLEGPQRQGVKVKKYTERLILTAVKETKTQKTKYAK